MSNRIELYSDKTPDSLRGHADSLDGLADEVMRRAAGEADDLRRRAADYRRIADEQDAQRNPVACRNCQQPIVRDALGWSHAADVDTSCLAPEPMDATVVDPQPEAAQVPEGEGS